MSRETNGGGAILMAFILGAISGAAVALLWAPAAGEETRRYLSERAREGRDRASEAAKEGREFVERQRDTVMSAIDRGREAYREAKEPKENA
ncbi:MAG: YtxH domain-containing protein [Acidobacteria bacterium]|nr:YtxH domain-containing protein [Acidobacteriota bacterium]